LLRAAVDARDLLYSDALSAEFVIAWPPFEMSWPAPATVLQPASAAVPAIRSRAMSRVMSVPLMKIASIDSRALQFIVRQRSGRSPYRPTGHQASRSGLIPC
jgi:hypothetical protein